MATQQEQEAKAAEDRRKARADAVKAAEETVDNQQRAQAASNMEVERRQNESKPTPTPREIDLARLGAPVLEKEDDGSGPDLANLSPEDKLRLEVDRRKAMEAGTSATYRTRDTSAAKPAAAVQTPPKSQS